jgi:hypothetical protein
MKQNAHWASNSQGKGWSSKSATFNIRWSNSPTNLMLHGSIWHCGGFSKSTYIFPDMDVRVGYEHHFRIHNINNSTSISKDCHPRAAKHTNHKLALNKTDEHSNQQVYHVSQFTNYSWHNLWRKSIWTGKLKLKLSGISDSLMSLITLLNRSCSAIPSVEEVSAVRRFLLTCSSKDTAQDKFLSLLVRG